MPPTLIRDPRLVGRIPLAAGAARRRPRPAARTAWCARCSLAEPPSLDAGEITDKGSLNQRAVLARRAALVEALYAAPPAPDVIRIGEES